MIFLWDFFFLACNMKGIKGLGLWQAAVLRVSVFVYKRFILYRHLLLLYFLHFTHQKSFLNLQKQKSSVSSDRKVGCEMIPTVCFLAKPI